MVAGEKEHGYYLVRVESFSLPFRRIVRKVLLLEFCDEASGAKNAENLIMEPPNEKQAEDRLPFSVQGSAVVNRSSPRSTTALLALSLGTTARQSWRRKRSARRRATVLAPR